MIKKYNRLLQEILIKGNAFNKVHYWTEFMKLLMEILLSWNSQ